MQNIIWTILLLAFIIDVFRRSLLNKEKNINEKADNINSNRVQMNLDKTNNLSRENF
jgi:hypothetical protein